MKPQPEMVEGPEAFQRFEEAMRKMTSVPHSVIQRKIEQQRKASAKNPKRRGPKRKV